MNETFENQNILPIEESKEAFFERRRKSNNEIGVRKQSPKVRKYKI